VAKQLSSIAERVDGGETFRRQEAVRSACGSTAKLVCPGIDFDNQTTEWNKLSIQRSIIRIDQRLHSEIPWWREISAKRLFFWLVHFPGLFVAMHLNGTGKSSSNSANKKAILYHSPYVLEAFEKRHVGTAADPLCFFFLMLLRRLCLIMNRRLNCTTGYKLLI
jgi:hypothetical protein